MFSLSTLTVIPVGHNLGLGGTAVFSHNDGIPDFAQFDFLHIPLDKNNGAQFRLFYILFKLLYSAFPNVSHVFEIIFKCPSTHNLHPR